MKRSPNKPQLKNEVFRTPQTLCPDEMLPQAQTRCSCQLQPHILITKQILVKNNFSKKKLCRFEKKICEMFDFSKMKKIPYQKFELFG